MTDYQIAIEGIGSILTEHEELIANFKKRGYSNYFMEFYRKKLPIFESIELLYNNVSDTDTMLSNMAAALTDSGKQILDSATKRLRPSVNINISLCMAAYVFPAILQFDGNSSKPLIEHIQVKWKEAFPKSNLTPATFDDVSGGFHRKWCYITTAACRIKGMEDNCRELNLLRHYRDTYMMNLPDGASMIHDYYDIAPSIVKHIARTEHPDVIYENIWDSYIAPCIEDIEEGRNESCLNRYIGMVNDLKETYFYAAPYRKDCKRS